MSDENDAQAVIVFIDRRVDGDVEEFRVPGQVRCLRSSSRITGSSNTAIGCHREHMEHRVSPVGVARKVYRKMGMRCLQILPFIKSLSQKPSLEYKKVGRLMSCSDQRIHASIA